MPTQDLSLRCSESYIPVKIDAGRALGARLRRAPEQGLRFTKYEALGNDYLVAESADVGRLLSPGFVRRLCDRHFGVGADGLLVSEAPSPSFCLRIFNSDGSEAEKSGNGLRIYARYLWDRDHVGEEPFAVQTSGGLVTCRVASSGEAVSVEMGRVSFWSQDIPVAGPDREVLREPLDLGGEGLEISAASIGNPHCVIVTPETSPRLARELGPRIETHPSFPRRTNVQFVQLLNRHAIRIEIWERGAGYTLGSGTSSCAAAAVCHRLGLCAPDVTVSMPGGRLSVEIAEDASVSMTGPARRVAEGRLSQEFLNGAV
jgi:diaminopimelate epimerase